MSDFPFQFGNIHGDTGFLKVREIQPGGYQVLPSLEFELQRIYNLELRPEDIWLIGLHKSGTTWATEMVWTTYHDADVTTARKKNHFERWICAEEEIYVKDILNVDKYTDEEKASMPENYRWDNITALTEWESPRFIKTHLPLSLLPPALLDTCKVVYIIRDFRDCWVSMYKMLSNTDMGLNNISFQDFVRRFLNGKAYLSPWTSAIKEGWEKRDHKNMFLVFYNEIRKDLPGVLRRLAEFLGKKLTEEQISILEDHLSLDNMRTNSSINFDIWRGNILKSKDFEFIGKGETGGWVNHFSPDLAKEYEEWWRNNMADSDIKFHEN